MKWRVWRVWNDGSTSDDGEIIDGASPGDAATKFVRLYNDRHADYPETRIVLMPTYSAVRIP